MAVWTCLRGLIIAVLKLAAGAQWSWWRVSLPLCAVLGHNVLYIIVGFVWLSLADDGAAEEAITIRPGDGGYGYQIAALVCFVVFADKVLRRIEGPGENMLWVSSGRWELIVVSGMLSGLCNSCSGLRLWIPVLDELTEGNGNSLHIPRGITLFDEFLDRTRSKPGKGQLPIVPKWRIYPSSHHA